MTFNIHQLLVGLNLGIVSHEEAISWADKKIGESDLPIPNWLIELSTSNGAIKRYQESILRGQTSDTEPSDNEFLGAMAVRLLDFEHPLGQILPLMYEHFCLSNRRDADNIRGTIYMIDDEFDWDKEQGIETAKSFLNGYLEEGRKLVESIKS